MVRATVPGISVRVAPGRSAEALGTLPAESRSFVVSGPVEADGYQWILLAGPGLPPGSGCATFPGPEFSCPTWFGWAAIGEPDAGDAWFVLDPTECPEPGLDPRAFMMLGDVEALHCYGGEEIEFVGWIPGPEAIREPGTCVGEEVYAKWLFCPGGYSMIVHANDTEVVAIELYVDPESNTDLAYPGNFPIVVGHLDDPAARDCDDAIPPGHPIVPGWAVLDCRTRFVVTTLAGVAP